MSTSRLLPHTILSHSLFCCHILFLYSSHSADIQYSRLLFSSLSLYKGPPCLSKAEVFLLLLNFPSPLLSEPGQSLNHLSLRVCVLRGYHAVSLSLYHSPKNYYFFCLQSAARALSEMSAVVFPDFWQPVCTRPLRNGTNAPP